MGNLRVLLGLCGLFLLTGCQGVGIFATSDPVTKLNDAEYLYTRESRPLAAERLIFEAMAIYRKQNNFRGLGNAYREYGDFLRSPALLGPEGRLYRENRFFDPSVTFANRFAKSLEYYAKALRFYARSERPLREDKRFDALTNTYFNMGYCYYMLRDHVKACRSYSNSLGAYKENIRLNPGAKPAGGSFASVPDAIAHARKVAGCA